MCGSVTLWCTFLTRKQFIDRINVVTSARITRSSASLTPYRTAIVSQFCLQLNLFRSETVQPFSGNSLISFSAIILEFVQIFN